MSAEVPREKPDFQQKLHEVPRKPGVYLMRDRLNRGILPPPDAVRVEELINYFSYDYRQPDEEVLKCIGFGRLKFCRISTELSKIVELE